MSTYVPHRIRSLGISNVTLPVLTALCFHDQAAVKPVVVQNRFYAATGYDVAIRALCAEQGITYQSFWTLTGNPRLLRSQLIREVADVVGVEVEVALYALVRGLPGDVVILNGTTSHMESDLEGMEIVSKWCANPTNEASWLRFCGAFQKLLATM